MNAPEFDADGYPTERTLKRIAGWSHKEGYPALMEFVRLAWRYPSFIVQRSQGHWELSTGGWSGNESIIGALQENSLFWLMYWESSRRGGHYEFYLLVEGGR